MNLAAAVGPTVASMAGQTLYDLELFNDLPPIANVTVSSVPGPADALWMAGRRVASAAPLGPLMGGIALNITVLGFGGFLEYGVLACAKKLPDLTELARPSRGRGESAAQEPEGGHAVGPLRSEREQLAQRPRVGPSGAGRISGPRLCWLDTRTWLSW